MGRSDVGRFSKSVELRVGFRFRSGPLLRSTRAHASLGGLYSSIAALDDGAFKSLCHQFLVSSPLPCHSVCMAPCPAAAAVQ